MRKSSPPIILTLLAATVLFHPAMYGASLTVLTVPWVATSPLTPHSAYITLGGTEIPVTLQATVPSAVGSTDSFSVTWVFGDGSANVTFALTNPYDISTVHTYPTAAVGTAWTATVTVKDTTSGATGSANYYVTQQKNTLAARVNVAIDLGLWYMHQTMWRNTTTVGTSTVNWGGWDTQLYGCPTVNGSAYDCFAYGSIDAANVQAYEVSGHLGNGPATDPYTDDVARGLARMFSQLANEANVAQTYEYNPAVVNYTCSNGEPATGQTPSTYPYCGTGTQIFYNASATSCTSPPCNVTFDGNSNKQMIYSNDESGEYIYTTGPFIDALVASANPTGTAPTGTASGSGLPGILDQTYLNIVQDMADWYGACQNETDYDLGNPGYGSYSGYSGYYRGYPSDYSGGGWLYDCQEGDDNSTSQWAAIGLIGANRGFGITTPQVIKDFNSVWVTNSQDVQNPVPTGTDPYIAGDDYGAFGYRGSFAYSNEWGPFAVTPSGMVQMALDGIGRTNNTAFGNPSNAPDQRFNSAETFYADNFCNVTSNGAYYAPRAYSYGMFSFTKSMLLHDPGGVLTPIQYLRTETPNVFPGNTTTGVPVNEIDWYAAVSSANGGTDPCDGVAQTLVDLQLAPTNGVSDGHWYGNDYYGYQFPYETAWSIIMLNKTVFVSCINNLAGRGNASGPGGAQTNLTWSAQTNATGYNVLRSSTNGGPYTLIGNTNETGYRDGNDGLIAGDTYYYVVQPLQGTTEICQSNQATIAIP
jgi:hypothetical protein